HDSPPRRRHWHIAPCGSGLAKHCAPKKIASDTMRSSGYAGFCASAQRTSIRTRLFAGTTFSTTTVSKRVAQSLPHAVVLQHVIGVLATSTQALSWSSSMTTTGAPVHLLLPSFTRAE